MSKETKFIIGAFIATILLIAGLVLLVTTKQKTEAAIPTTPVAGITVSTPHYDLGNVPIGGGIVTKEYELKNLTGKEAVLQKIVTSCMCTTASLKVGDKETGFFGMEMNGIGNPFVNVKIPKDASFKVSVRFDPAAHGPAGTGPFNRSIWLSFSQPGGTNELTFSGVVVK